eukprot:TRINITY_DN31259_c0_g1_i1.p1 TRINITY_DN31259_c0_g1~~TRINITY_DN31259_c0_g1_i1.p1  ORF type:complete len:916 (-),score=177.15 TRINITY_DN31259_c0_g1_i1:198-2945(-)
MTAAFARKRLLRDWAEVLREPSSLVAAAPLEDNIFEWHANLRPNQGPLVGIIFHVRIVFPQDYPNSPPNLLFPRNEIPSFRHPNLYSFGLCLDILSSFIGIQDKRAGWSPAYSVRTLLMQLQSFLFEFHALPQDHGGNYSYRYDAARIRDVRHEAGKFRCKSCGHCANSPAPHLQPETDSPRTLQVQQTDAVSSLAETNHKISEAMVALARLKVPGPLVVGESKPGNSLWSAGDETRHLRISNSKKLKLRVVAVQPGGLLRIGLGGSGCLGLTCSKGCVAWDSEGCLVLGNQVHKKRSMPAVCFDDEISVAAIPGAAGGIDHVDFSLNGALAAHDSSVLWPQRPLACFLSDEAERSMAHGGVAAQVETIGAWLSFRNATVEVLCNTEFRDVTREAVLAQRKELEAELARHQRKRRSIVERVREDRERVMMMRAETPAQPWAHQMPNDLLLLAFLDLDADDVLPLLRVCRTWRKLVTERGLLERLQLCCFYTKSRPSEDVLGFGVSAAYHRDGNLKELSTELDVISEAAFSKFSLRRGAWGEDFQYFLPLVLDGSHMQRALPTLEQSLVSLAMHDKSSVARMPTFQPWMALAVLPQLMNSFAVSLMNSKQEVTRHASEKALLGYCSFHHMLLALCAKHPSIERVATKKLQNFIRREAGRHKSETPDLGQLLIYSAISREVRWQHIAEALVQEASVRSVMWLVREKPSLEGGSDSVMLQACFAGRLTSLRLLMFQAFFLSQIACPEGKGPDAALARYGRQFGLPTEAQKESLFKAAKEILAVSTWPQYYAHLRLRCPSRQEQVERLRKSFQDSAFCGYHTPSADTSKVRRAAAAAKVKGNGKGQRQERMGIQQDLRSAFARETIAEEMRRKSVQRQGVTHSGARPSKAAALPQKAPTSGSAANVHVSNKFGALCDSD